MTEEELDQLMSSGVAAYNNHDVDGYMTLFAPVATFSQLGGRTLLDSREAMHGYYRQLFEARPTIRCQVLQRSMIGAFVVEQQEISGEGQPGMQALVISEVRDKRIQRVWYAPLTAGSTH